MIDTTKYKDENNFLPITYLTTQYAQELTSRVIGDIGYVKQNFRSLGFVRFFDINRDR